MNKIINIFTVFLISTGICSTAGSTDTCTKLARSSGHSTLDIIKDPNHSEKWAINYSRINCGIGEVIYEEEGDGRKIIVRIFLGYDNKGYQIWGKRPCIVDLFNWTYSCRVPN